MRRGMFKLMVACVVAGSVFAAGAEAQRLRRSDPRVPSNPCARSQEAAVECFVRNAVEAGMVDVPDGMTMSQFAEYGNAVAELVRTPDTMVFLLGTMAAVADAMPGSNPEQLEAQRAGVTAILAAAIKARLLTLPAETSSRQLNLFAGEIAEAMGEYRGTSLAPGAPLRMLDAVLLSTATLSSEPDLTRAQEQIAKLIDGLLAAGLLRLPPGVSADALKQFSYEVALAVMEYKKALGIRRLPAPR